MKLLDQYLQSVRFWLPKPQRDDIVREVEGDIQSQIDEKEAELGRQLGEPELEQILKRWGQPLLVAERYLPEQCLIGPVLYPLYLFVLKIVALVYLLPWLAVWLGLLIFSGAHPAAEPLTRVGDLWSWWSIVLHAFFFITIGFAFVEKYKLRSWLAQEWSPRQLPTKADPNLIPLSSSILELVLNVVFAVWLLRMRGASGSFAPEGGPEVTLAPIWQTLYWPALLVFVFGALLSILNLIRPYKTVLHAALRVAASVYCLVLIGWLLTGGRWVTITAADPQPAKIETVERWLNLSILVTLLVIGAVCVVEAYGNARWLLREKTKKLAALALVIVAAVFVPHGRAAGAERVDGNFDSGGVTIRYITEGDGEPVVLIHGFAANAEMWNPLLPELAKEFRAIALDCRGHGKSNKPHDPKLHGRETIEDIVRLLDHLRINKAHVIGYSMGAEIAGHLAVLHPGRLLSVTLGGGGVPAKCGSPRARSWRRSLWKRGMPLAP